MSVPKSQETNPKVFNAIEKFRNRVVTGIVDFIIAECSKNNGKMPKAYNLRKQYDDLFIQWMFQANDADCLDPITYVPCGNIIDVTNVVYTLKQFIPKSVSVSPDEWKWYDNTLADLRKEVSQLNGPPLEIVMSTEHDVVTLKPKHDDTLKPMKLTKSGYTRLKEIYTGESDAFNRRVFTLLTKYTMLGGLNINLSVPDILQGKKHVELFGSPLNTRTAYCSPFQDEVKYFSSLGSFFKYKLQSNGLYIANPPFNNDIINRMADRLLFYLSNTDIKNLTIIVVLPVWDSESRIKLKLTDYKEPFPGYEKLKQSKYLSEHTILDKDQYPFINYYTNQLVPASYSHLMILSNMSTPGIDLKTITTHWKHCCRA